MAFTYFFRDMHTLELIVRCMTPWARGRSRVRIWDAGCATGQEAYSLAMMFAENMGHFAFRNLHIDATDVDGSNLFGALISEGLYQGKELQRMPKAFFDKYFQPSGKTEYFKVVDSIRSRVCYQKHDLLSLQPIGEDFSLILCKNVLLHFQYAERVEVIKMFHKALAPGGYFATEQTQKLPEEVSRLFEKVTANAQLFRKIPGSREDYPLTPVAHIG
ncbi:MAG: CheR family methyltransferase [bacterium]